MATCFDLLSTISFRGKIFPYLLRTYCFVF